MSTLPKMNFEGYWNSNSIANYTTEYIKNHLYGDKLSYLRQHPELRAIIRVFLHELIDKQPDDIYEFSAALFNCNNSPLLVAKINQQLKRVKEILKKSHWSEYDGEMFFSEMGSTHSLLSRTSIENDKENILRYAMLMDNQN